MTVDLLDVNYYRATNSDLVNLTPIELIAHFNNFGLNEQRQFSPLVNLNVYRASNSDLANFSYRQTYEHLRNFGIREGRLFSPIVDLGFYKSQNTDLQSFNNEQLFEHLKNFGVNERRKFSPFFDTNLYRAANPDVNSAFQGNGLQILEHFLINGLREGRQFSNAFDVNYYRAIHPDLVAVNFNNHQLLEHFVVNGLNEGRASAEGFNVQYYLANNSDLQTAFNSNFRQTFEHFIQNGLTERRLASPPIASDYAGNTLNTARGIAIDNNSAIFRDSIGFRDTIDLYRFDLSTIRGSSIDVKLYGQLTSSIQLELLNANGSVLQNSNDGGNTWNLNNTFDAFRKGAGIYYIQVKVNNGFSTTANYNLSINTSSLTTGNSLTDRLIDLTNQERINVGRVPLLLNPKLTVAAQTHSQDMAINDFFDITDETLGRRAREVGYEYSLIGGSIVGGTTSPEEVINYLLDRPNRINILLDSRFQEIGSGFFYLENDPGIITSNYYWTQIVGKPQVLR